MTVQERSDNFKRWIHESDIFEMILISISKDT